ncbi:unnamed protein product [Adineta steineri]|uniref:Phage tail collar domain-containing protein n=1 Tax=Adineta steineri TaxID=433720 RepID=A0A814Y000_9BILA|nr:unnamed protein product [Adineta steineri]
MLYNLDSQWDLPPGVILAFAGNTVPHGWSSCDGNAISRLQYQNLFLVIGTIYGVGDHVTTFNLPDFRGRTLVGVGQGPTLTNRLLGQRFGTENHILSVNEMPAHSHDVNDPGHAHKMGNPVGQVWETAGGKTNRFSYGVNNLGVSNNPPTQPERTGISLKTTGSGAAHNNMPPSLAINYIIKY